MSDSPASARSRWRAGLLLLLALGAAVHLPRLSAPLLEGAAGKQTHTAMVARNLYRGRATLSRPRVDDVGKPGYFVKELPVVPALAAAVYTLTGAVDERVLRAIGLLFWLGAAALFAGLVRPALGPRGALLAVFWFLAAPISLVYASAAMNDALAVAVSLAALATLSQWRAQPGHGPALLSAGLVGAAFLAKPHTAFWLGPAAAMVALSRAPRGAKPRPARRNIALMCAYAGLALGLACLWYLHAASIHRLYPVPGATVARGWVAPALWGRAALYREIGRQTLFMVLTPPGAAAAIAGLLRGPRFTWIERALLAWGGGVLLQCLVFAPRMFDELSRGTEYYQLPLVAPAALLIGRGLDELARWAAPWPPWRRATVLGGAVLCLAGMARVQAWAAARPPERYGSLIEDCAIVRAVTRPTDELIVLADRGGRSSRAPSRRGRAFSLATAVNETVATLSERASPADLAEALRDARYLYIPFPELLGDDPALADTLGTYLREVPLPGSRARLFERSESPLGPRRRP